MPKLTSKENVDCCKSVEIIKKAPELIICLGWSIQFFAFIFFVECRKPTSLHICSLTLSYLLYDSLAVFSQSHEWNKVRTKFSCVKWEVSDVQIRCYFFLLLLRVGKFVGQLTSLKLFNIG